LKFDGLFQQTLFTTQRTLLKYLNISVIIGLALSKSHDWRHLEIYFHRQKNTNVYEPVYDL